MTDNNKDLSTDVPSGDPTGVSWQPSGEARVLVQGLRDAVPYIREQEGQLFVVAFGGEALDEPASFERLIRDIVLIADLGVRLVLVSANEGWQVAGDIARAGVPVITLGIDNLPGRFEQLGATMSNVGRMVAAGVTVALGTPDHDVSFQPRLLPQYAGNLVAQARLPDGVGLNWDQAFAAITAAPAEIFGLADRGRLTPGAVADVVIWSGDPLELSSAPERMFIGGAEQLMDSRQRKLARRYLPGAADGWPAGYRR